MATPPALDARVVTTAFGGWVVSQVDGPLLDDFTPFFRVKGQLIHASRISRFGAGRIALANPISIYATLEIWDGPGVPGEDEQVGELFWSWTAVDGDLFGGG